MQSILWRAFGCTYDLSILKCCVCYLCHHSPYCGFYAIHFEGVLFTMGLVSGWIYLVIWHLRSFLDCFLCGSCSRSVVGVNVNTGDNNISLYGGALLFCGVSR